MTLWVMFLIGMLIGGVIGVIVGIVMSDRWWRKNVGKYSHLIPNVYAQNEYKKGSKNDDKN